MKTRFILLFLTLYLVTGIPAIAENTAQKPYSAMESVRSIIPNMKSNPMIAEGDINNDALKDTVLLVRYDKPDNSDKTKIREMKQVIIISEKKNNIYSYSYPLWGHTQEWYSEPNRTESIWITGTTLYLREIVKFSSGTYTTTYQFKADKYGRLSLTKLEYKASSSTTDKPEEIKMDFDPNKIFFNGFSLDTIYKIAGLKSTIVDDYTTLITDFHRLYTGRISDKYNITMYLEKNGKKITGYYRYRGQENSLLVLNGTVDSSGKVTIEESVNRGPYMETTGIFSGKISGTTITGEWHTPDNSKKMNFEVSQASKKGVLQHAIGTYHLSSIQGWWGANTMFDSYKETNGGWSSNASALSGGMREGWDVTLSNEDIKLLNSMYIQVDANLTVRFFAGGKPLLEVPFNETGMKYTIKPKQDDPYMYLSTEKLSPSTIFIDEKLYLAAIDDADYSDTIPASDYIMANTGPVSLTYSPLGDGFSLHIGYGGDSNILSFTRK